MSPDPGFERFHEFFTATLGLTVEVIRRTNDKSADAFVNGESPGYAVELKARCNRDNFASDLTKGGPFGVVEKPDFDVWVINQAREALKQLESNDPQRKRIWVLWIDTSRRTETGLGFEQALGTVFGIRTCIDQQFESYRCLQASVSLFERFPKLDTIVVRGEQQRMALCVNEESERFEVVSSSNLFSCFASHGGVCMVSSLQTSGFLAVDPECVDRTSESSVQEYLEKTYKLQEVRMCDPKSYVSSMRLPPRNPVGADC